MEDSASGKLLLTFILAALLSCAAAWVIARRYRAAMARLVRAPLAAPPATPDAVEATRLPPAEPVSLADNRRAGSRLALVLIGQSLLIAATAASLWWWLGSLAARPGQQVAFPSASVSFVYFGS